MPINLVDWRNLDKASGNNLRNEVFLILRNAALALQTSEPDDARLLELVPRLASLIAQREELWSLREAFGALARATGLWNYIDKESADYRDRLIAETVTLPELSGVTLHREQIAALSELLSGKNLILSAPTSFGKSLLIDALLASGLYTRVAIVLPTIALLDEFRRRLRRRFSDNFEVIMHPGDRPGEGRTIFLGTQERLINRTDLGRIDLTVVDEFYKLDPNRRDERSVALNAAVYRLLQRSKQFFFLGPNIDNVQVSSEGRWQFQFLRTRFSTVAVDTFDLRNVENKQERLFEEVSESNNWPALVFVSSPDRANKLSHEASDQLAVSDSSSAFAEWLSYNVGPGWPLVKAVKFGFGVHHGRIPRAVASHMVRLFNKGDLPVLFCTSTLIEGVNTAAKTVLIFDKKISTRNYDFFTFSNIKGRAGRLGQHYVGQVFLFNAPPDEEGTDVSPTLFGVDDDAPDDYLVHLDEADTSPAIDDRVSELRNLLGLDKEQLRLASAVGLEIAAALKNLVTLYLARGRPLVWSGVPSYENIRALADIICEVKTPRDFGALSSSQLTWLINNLRLSRTLRNFLIDFDRKFVGNRSQFDNVFKFLRSCEYGLPQLFSVVELFVRSKQPIVDYSLFLHELSRWFRAEELKNLDEEGIPIQISERLYKPGDDRNTLTARLAEAALNGTAELTQFERDWVISALEIETGQSATARS